MWNGILNSSPTSSPVVCVNNHKALDASVCNHCSIPAKRMAGRTEGNRGRCAGGGSMILSMGVWRVLKPGTSWRSRRIWRRIRVMKSEALSYAIHLVRARETRHVSKYLTWKHSGTDHLKERRRVRQEINAVMHVRNTVNIRHLYVFLFSSYIFSVDLDHHQGVDTICKKESKKVESSYFVFFVAPHTF